MSVPGAVVRKLSDYIGEVTKYMQNVIDHIHGEETDNSSEPMQIPSMIHARCRGQFNSMLADNFNTTWWGYGHWGFLYDYDVFIAEGAVTLSNWTYIGRYKKSTWDAIHPYSGGTPNAEVGAEMLSNYIAAHPWPYIDKRGTEEPIIPRYTYSDSHCLINLMQYINGTWTAQNVRFRYQAYSGETGANNQKLKYGNYAISSVNGDYVECVNDPAKIVQDDNMTVSNGDAVFITQTTDQTFINNYITDNDSEHNYTYNYTTQSGDNITVYYGDNYIIYEADDDAEITYNENYYILRHVTDKISADTGEPIHVPTYNENKGITDLDDDIEVDMSLNNAAFGTGLSHYYVTTVDAPVLSDISEAMSSWDINNTGKDLYRNLLSCRITKVGPIPSESSTFVIYGEELQYNGSPITITKITGNPSMDLGEYEILPKFNDFRDYAPFTKIEMFIPYCGWVSLPSHCMSSEDKPKIITGTLLCDIIAGTCKAVIKCNDTVVAEASGFTAIDVPFTGENVGMKMAGIASSITSYGNQAAKTVGSVASGAMTGGAGAGAALAGGIVGMVGSYAQMYSAFNANYTEICGKTGDGCNVAGLGKVYIKIQRPKTGGTSAPYYVPDNYAHTTGFMSMKQKQISECNGLIVCANVDTSGISGATARERAEIKRLLETGIYVNLPEPEPPEP